ncbi:MAG: 23S rRNA (adenine(2503)-C(2))-methyltransferase RlmN [Cyanobacteria bacterium P01_H01_bin.162]
MASTSPELTTTTTPLLGQSLEELTDWVKAHGQSSYRGKQLHQWLYEKYARSLADVTVFSKEWRAEVAAVPVGRSQLHFRSVAPDGTVKYLLKLADGHIIEAVGIPTERRLTVCVSSQVGCPMACDFCATGKGGFLRNLETHEIVDQVLTVQEDFEQRVSNIVFMGMGEPLLNQKNVVKAVRSLNQDVGISQRSITVSTVGIPGQIRRLAAEALKITLAVSLHASNQTLRETLIPSARQYPLEALMEECREYLHQTRRRISFEYILLSGLNDLPHHAAELAEMVGGFQSHVNLIPYNPISEVDYQRPSDHQIQTFVDELKQRNVVVSVRYSRGLEKDAACGQLRAQKLAS